jgi:hypothetical protein
LLHPSSERHNPEDHDLKYYGYQMKRITWVGHAARIVKMRNECKILVEEPEGKRTSGRPTRRWDDNIKMNLKKVVYESAWVREGFI